MLVKLDVKDNKLGRTRYDTRAYNLLLLIKQLT